MFFGEATGGTKRNELKGRHNAFNFNKYEKKDNGISQFEFKFLVFILLSHLNNVPKENKSFEGVMTQ